MGVSGAASVVRRPSAALADPWGRGINVKGLPVRGARFSEKWAARPDSAGAELSVGAGLLPAPGDGAGEAPEVRAVSLELQSARRELGAGAVWGSILVLLSGCHRIQSKQRSSA